MDFGPFGIGVAPEQLQQFRMFMAQQHQQQQQPPSSQPQQGASNQPGEGDAGQRGSEQPQQNSERPQGQSGNDSGDAQQQQGDSPVLMHNSAHSGVICDICNSEIKGFRYKCMQCPDFDLCSKCEHKGHHAGHVMMRISFPEQTRDAIRKYLSNCPPSPPPHGRHGHGHHGHHHGPHPFAGPQGPEGFPFVFGRRPHCGRRGQGHGHSQEQNSGSDDERPATAPGKKLGKFGKGRAGRIEKRCPYNMGKKEFKKWSKWVKRAAQHQHRSAEAYARAAAAAGENGGPAASASTGAAAAPECPVDFQAVASQIQEFLNYFGIPVDVVELYDQLGNGGQSNAAQNPQSTSQGTTTGEQTQTSTGTQQGSANATATNAGPSSQEQQPASPAAANLSENMQQMRIDEVQNVSGPQDESLLMDLDAENSGWTILNNQSREQTPSNTAPVAAPESQQPSAPQGPDAANNANGSPQGTPTGSINSNNGNGNNTPFASMGSNSSIGKSAAAPSAPSYPSGIPNVPLYPVLNQPQIQQILQNVSSAVNSVVRSIPIVTDPRGPVGTNVTSATNGQVPATGTETSDGQDVQLDARCMKTLNQLLAMGFSNEGGYLTRLVIAKNGDLEAVLGSLFPN